MRYNIKENLSDLALILWLTKDNFKELKNLIKVKGVRGSAVERKIAQDLNSEFTDLHGSDEIDLSGRVIETKMTKSTNNGLFEIGNVLSKKTKCHFIRVIDLINFRWFEIPHDVFFDQNHGIKVYKRGIKKISDSFHFSASYNKTDKKSVHNTSLLLKYEIKQ